MQHVTAKIPSLSPLQTVLNALENHFVFVSLPQYRFKAVVGIFLQIFKFYKFLTNYRKSIRDAFSVILTLIHLPVSLMIALPGTEKLGLCPHIRAIKVTPKVHFLKHINININFAQILFPQVTTERGVMESFLCPCSNQKNQTLKGQVLNYQ